MADASTDELLQLNGRLLDSIDRSDWNTYQSLCDPTHTAFEPESLGQLIEGLEFHRFFFFNRGGIKGDYNTTMCAPRVRLMGDVALVTYTRLTQRLGADGMPTTVATEETRVWQRRDGAWKHVHFHRSNSRA